MKYLNFQLTVIILCILGILPWMNGNAQGWRPGEMEVRVKLEKVSDIHWLQSHKLNYDQPKTLPGIARLYLTPSELEILKKENYAFEISISDLNEYYRDFWNPNVPSGYYTYQQIINIADSLVGAFPDICQKIIIGQSGQGRQLAVLKISDNATTNEAEPEVFFEAGIHGDEIGTVENIIRFARDLCKGYGTNTQITNLVNTREIFLLLMVNPDGRESMSRYNANYVDINRDGGYMWNGEGNSPAAWSQVETKAIRNFLNQRHFVVFTDYHSGTEFISYPWSYRPDVTLDQTHIHNLAAVYANNSGYSNIPYAAGYAGMYPINGSTKDFNYGMWGSVAWSIEISNSKQPPASQIYYYYNKNKPAMLSIIQYAGYGIGGMVYDSITGQPVAARIRINGTVPIYNDPEVGDFHKYVVPGTYNVEVAANGYQTKTITGVNVSAYNAVQLNISLSPSQGRYAYKVLGSYIPGNNFDDEGYTWAALGAPDNINYSLGKNGWIILDMKDTIYNGNGNDFRVTESDNNPEAYTVYASMYMDGPWKLVGSATGMHEFNLGNASLNKARYIKIQDNGTGSAYGNNAGFDLDAVEILYTPVNANFVASNTLPCTGTGVNFSDASAGNPTSWQWSFSGGSPASSTQQNPQGIIYNTPGMYDVTLTVSDGTTTSTLTRQAYIQAFGNPDAPSQPTGDSAFCRGVVQSEYTTTGAANATDYEWVLNPVESGTLNTTWNMATVAWNPQFYGIATLRVRQHTPCGLSEWSEARTVEIAYQPLVNLGNDTLVPAFAKVILDAGNPGCSYLWNTGETTQTIIADTTGFGAGTRTYSVLVTSPGGCMHADTLVITFSIEAGRPEYNCDPLIAFPNPAREYINFKLAEPSQVFIYSVEGKLVETIITTEPILRWSNPGNSKLYFYKIITKNKFYTGKILFY
ncbi:MAG: PKD domain-containing protein [Bacteroidales bacterium]|nr:PKD domain-containing protein [Bacteroidales bacterium]NPV36218.1 PKD domain-containing protein [Bacteroidales bacterium]